MPGSIVRPADPQPTPAQVPTRRFSVGRLLPLAALAIVTVTIIAMGWHRELSLENLVRHRATIDAFIATHAAAAIGAFVLLYVAVVALSIPGAAILTIASGIVFGTVVGALAVIVGATIGATIIFLIARSALGDLLVRRAGPLAEKLAEGFRADAFNYLLFLRLVPLFPFFLVNLVPALLGVRLATFVTATAIGIIPGTFAFAFFGAGLNSVIAAQEAAFKACLAAGRGDCRLDFDLKAVATPHLLAAVVVLGVIALVPVIVKRWRTARAKRDGRDS
jgi:uncharacterized membrane protein YdjX (TVP38/TMEM64 family)